jgi:hypothetical protein
MNKKAMDAMKQVQAAVKALEMSMNMPMEDGEEAESYDPEVSNETKGMEGMESKKNMVVSMMKKKMGM